MIEISVLFLFAVSLVICIGYDISILAALVFGFFLFFGYGLYRKHSVKEMAVKAGLKELYLFTIHDNLYEKFGWTFVQEIDTFLEPRIRRLYHLDC